MALEQAVRDLQPRLDRFHDAVHALRVTFLEDKPAKGGDVALFDYFELGSEDMLGWLNEAQSAAERAVHAVEVGTVDLNRVRRSLWQCQERFHRLSRHFLFELAPFDRLCDLMDLGRSRKGEWLGWTRSVRDALSSCRQPLQELYEGLSLCWWELSERAGMNSVSLSSTNIGQQIELHDARSLSTDRATGT